MSAKEQSKKELLKLEELQVKLESAQNEIKRFELVVSSTQHPLMLTNPSGEVDCCLLYTSPSPRDRG